MIGWVIQLTVLTAHFQDICKDFLLWKKKNSGLWANQYNAGWDEWEKF